MLELCCALSGAILLVLDFILARVIWSMDSETEAFLCVFK
jgi:hypothetical protein